MTRSTNQFESKIRRESFILNPQMRHPSNGSTIFNESDPNVLTSLLYEIEGEPTETETARRGWFYLPDTKQWMESYLHGWKGKLKQVDEEFKRFQKRAQNEGNKRPTVLPDKLLEKQELAEAKITVHLEECEWLKSRIIKLEEESHKTDVDEIGIDPNRQAWASGRLQAGIMVEYAKQRCAINEDGILSIVSKKSPYFGMPLWRFKSEICNPMFLQYKHLNAIERKAALKENRPRRFVPFPEAPFYDQKTGYVTYPATYHNNVLAKLKK